MYCLPVVYISVISFSDTGEETQQSSPVASRNRFRPWGLRCSLHVERSRRFSITHVYYVRVLVMSARKRSAHTVNEGCTRDVISFQSWLRVSNIYAPRLIKKRSMRVKGHQMTLAGGGA